LVVLQVIARFNVGGTAKYLLEVSNNMSKIGIQTIIATGQVQGSEVEDKDLYTVPYVKLKSLGRKINPIKDFFAMREIKNLILEINPDVVHTHTFKAGVLTRIQQKNLEDKLQHKIIFIHTFHGHLFDDPEFGRLKRYAIAVIERFLAKRTDRLVTVGQSVMKDLDYRGIKGKTKSVSIPPCVEPLKLITKDKALKKFKVINKKSIKVLWLARVTGVKNPKRVIEIAKLLPQIDFFMAGGGDLLETMQQNAPKNLRILGWQKANELLPITDLFLSTSENEGMPIAIIEAQLAGVPVIATNVGSVSEVVRNHSTGIVCPKDNEKLSLAISKLANNRNLRLLYGRNAKANSKKEYSLHKFISAHKKLYLK